MISAFSAASQERSISKPNERIFKNAFELRHDNDFLLFTDRYYTTGIFIGITSLSEKNKDSTQKTQFRFYLQQEIYTPSDLLEENTASFDIPYAGFLGLSNGITLSNSKRLLDFELVYGFSGPMSGAEWLQSYFHETAAEGSRVATWKDQIKTNLHINVYLNYIREWKLNPNPFSVHVALNPKGAIGTRDIYVQNDVVFYFGKRNDLKHTAAYQQLGRLKNELYFDIRLGYRYVFHNALLEGATIWKDTSLFVKEPYNNQFFYNFGITHRRKRNTYRIGYHFSAPITRGAQPHLYMLMSFSRNF